MIPDNSSILSSIAEIPVPFPFLIFVIVVIVAAFLLRYEYPKMFAPLFVYSFAGLAELGVLILWIVLIFVRDLGPKGSEKQALKYVAIAIVAIYFLFNFTSFLLYMLVTKKDRKFVVWQKQDNQLSTGIVTAISLAVTFRFSVLKFSKLANLPSLSATLSK